MSRMQAVENVVVASGLWNNGRRDGSHGFILSPGRFEITQSQQEALTMLGRSLYECLAGMGRIFAIASNQRLSSGRTWDAIGKALRTGVPSTYRETQIHKPGETPEIFRADVMIGVDGQFSIAEIEGQKKHGLGYSVLASRVSTEALGNSASFAGVAASLASVVAKKRLPDNRLTLLYADQEEFYVPEFMILKAELKKFDVELAVCPELNVRVDNGTFIPRGEAEQPHTLIDFPFFYHHPQLNAALERHYLEGTVNFLIPPKPFLGSKTMLAILRNDEQNPELENILRSQIKSESLDRARAAIPETYLVHTKMSPEIVQAIEQKGGFIVKEVLASGMKGIGFDEDDDFLERFAKARKANYLHILQREIETARIKLPYFTDEGEERFDDWYLRIGVFYAKRGISDISVTARRDKRVHGATDCLQIGTVVV